MIPIQFEYVEKMYSYGYPIDVPKFVVVLDLFRHHYNGEMMYRIRVDHINPLNSVPVTEYMARSETQMLELLKTRVTED